MLQKFNGKTFARLIEDTGPEITHGLLSSVRVEIANRTNQILWSAQAQDFESVTQHAHAIKACCQTVGLDHLAALSEWLEAAARDRRGDTVNALSCQVPKVARMSILATSRVMDENAGLVSRSANQTGKPVRKTQMNAIGG